jgi:signal transduction histidine kinase
VTTGEGGEEIAASSSEMEVVFAAGGAAGARMGAFDFAGSPLGPVDRWPGSLRSAVAVCLESAAPVAVCWGPELVLLANDAFCDLLGERPLPRPAREVWAGRWPELGPALAGVLTGAEPGGGRLRAGPNGHGGGGALCSLGPVHDEWGRIAGVLVVAETAGPGPADGRLRALGQLSRLGRGGRSAVEACRAAGPALTGEAAGLAFALLYLLSPDGGEARLAWASQRIEGAPDVASVDDLLEGLGRPALVLPLPRPPPDPAPRALLVAGVDPRVPFDEARRTFLDLVTGQVAASIAEADRADEARRARADAILALTSAGEHARTEGDVQVFLGRLTATTADLLGAERVLLWRLDGGRLRPLLAPDAVESLPCPPGGHGPVERAVLDDVPAVGNAGPLPADQWAAVGWRLGTEPLGMLTAYGSRRPDGFDEGDVWLLRIAALTAALVCRHQEAQDRERAATEEERRRVRELGLMQDMARKLASTLDPESVLDELALAAARIASPDAPEPGSALVLRADPDAGRVAVVAPAAQADGPFERALQRHVAYVMESGRPIQFTRDEVATAPERRHLAEAGLGAVALVPLPVGDEPFGVLAVGLREDRAITPQQLRRLALLADLGGLAVANATAYQREHRARETSQERLRELTLLHEATSKLSSTLAVDEIEREVVRTAARLVAPEGSERRAIFTRIDGETATVAHEEDSRELGHAGLTFPVSAHRELRAALERRRAVTAPIGGLGLGTAALRHAVARLSATHAAFAPVFVQDEPYGVVAVTVEDGTGFDHELLRRLEALASLAELAIANGRHFEAVRREGERMAELEDIKSKFLRLASHELRSPLAVLRGYLSMLGDGTFGEPDAEVANVYAVLDAKAGQMEMLVTQMLEAARLEEGRLRMDLRRLDLRAAVRDAFASSRLTARPVHDLRLVLPEEPVEVVADAWRVTTIVANLLDNAIKYSLDGGLVRCAVRTEGDSAVVEVADRGLGIAESDRATLFTRFGRIVTKENSHIQGTGLGLYLSRELAHMQGGTLDVTSKAGAGSTFTLTLPLAPAAG